MAKCFITKFLGEIDNDNLPIYDTFVIHVTPNVANAGNLAARIINFQSPKDIVISTKDGGNHIAYVKEEWISTEPTNITNKVTVPANTKAGVYMKDDVAYDVLVSGLYSFTYIGSSTGGSSNRGFSFDINQLSNSINLQTLKVYRASQVSGDIANLKDLTNLQTLDLNYSQVSGDIANLKGLTNLQTLILNGATQVSGDIANLKGLTNLQILNLYGATQVSGDIANLKGLTNLQTLDLYGATQVSGDIANLKDLTNLQTLGLNDSHVSGDITELKTLIKLTGVGIRPAVPNTITGDVKVLFDAMAKTNRNNSCEITWNKTACTYSGDTSIKPTEAKKFIKATFDGNGGYTVTNYNA